MISLLNPESKLFNFSKPRFHHFKIKNKNMQLRRLLLVKRQQKKKKWNYIIFAFNYVNLMIMLYKERDRNR